MATPLKDLYNKTFFNECVNELSGIIPTFPKEPFINAIFNDHWEQLELKERMYHASKVLHTTLDMPFSESVKVVVQLAQNLIAKGNKQSLEYMFLPDYIEKYGMDEWDLSMEAMEEITSLTSCEFAIRPFIIANSDKTMQRLLEWSSHPNEHIRRLASEGSRPRLPWAIALPAFKDDPTPVLPILENLKDDPSEYVRRSVANNLNDISKDNISIFMDVITKWKGGSEKRQKLIKHASRTLFKAGNIAILHYYDLNTNGLSLTNYTVKKETVLFGDEVRFSFKVNNQGQHDKYVRFEYAMYFLLKNGKQTRKVFKISERTLAPNTSIDSSRHHSFKPISTRTYYPGIHRIALILNGSEQDSLSFELLKT